MKKNILICLVIFVLTLMQSVHAEENDKISGLLTSIGLLDSKELKDMDAEITRGEFVQLASRLIPYTIEYTDEEQKFADVPYGSDIYNSVMCMAEFGIVNGVSAVKFVPDETIKYNDACAVIVRLLGYDIGVTDGNYITQANSLKITKGVSPNNGVLTKEDAIKMIYNALFTDIKYSNNIDGFSNEFDIAPLMEKRFDIYEVNGIVTDNGKVALTEQSSIGKENIKIDNSVYVNSSNQDFIGCNVYAYCRINDETEEVLFMYASDNKNEIFEYTEEDIADFNNGVYSVYVSPSQSSIKKRTLETDYKLIYNMSAVTGNITQEKLDAVMKPKCGKVKLIDNNNNGKYDVVIIENYETVVVKGYSGDSETVYNQYSEPAFVTFKDIGTVEAENASGTLMQIDMIQKYNVLSIMRSIDGEYAKMIISTQTVKGILTSFTEEKYMTVNNTIYEIPEELIDVINIPKIGREITIHLRHDGRVAYINEGEADGIMAYLKNVYYLDDADGEVGITVYTEEKEIKKLKLVSKPVLDGDKFKSYTAVYDYIKNHPYGINNLVIMNVNDKEEVTKIDFAFYKEDVSYNAPKANESENSWHVAGTRSKVFGTIGRILKSEVAVDETTKIFVIPSNVGKTIEKMEDVDFDKIDLAEINISNINAGNIVDYNAQYVYTAYIADEKSMVADAIVLFRNTAGWDLNVENVANVMGSNIITGIYQAINPDGETCWMFEYSTGGTTSQIYTQTLNGNKCKETGDEVRVGDIIRYGTSKSGRIPDNQLVIMYSPSRDKDNLIFADGSFKKDYIPSLTGTYTYGLIMGKVEEMNDRFIKILRNDGTKRLVALSTIKYIVYDENERKKVRFGNWTDINTVLDVGEEEANRIVFNWYDESVLYAYIIK